MRLALSLGAGLLGLLLFGRPARADRVVLKGGKHVVGVVMNDREKFVIVMLTEEGPKVFPRSDIESGPVKDSAEVNALLQDNFRLKEQIRTLQKGSPTPAGPPDAAGGSLAAQSDILVRLQRIETQISELSARLDGGAPKAGPKDPAEAGGPKPGPGTGPAPSPIAVVGPSGPRVSVPRADVVFYTPAPPAKPYFGITGWVQNDGAAAAHSIEVRIVFMDQNDRIIDVETTELFKGGARTLKPGEKFPFQVYPDPTKVIVSEDGGPAKAPKYEIRLDWKPVVAPGDAPPGPGAAPPGRTGAPDPASTAG